MAENTLALIKHLTSASSPLPELAAGYSRPHTVYMGYLGRVFIKYSFTTAKIMYSALFAAVVVYAKFSFTPAKRGEGFWKVQAVHHPHGKCEHSSILRARNAQPQLAPRVGYYPGTTLAFGDRRRCSWV